MTYVVTYANVDGAGRYADEYASLEEAVIAADLYAADSNAPRDGFVNPWRYTYAVRDEQGRVVYRPVSVHGRRL